MHANSPYAIKPRKKVKGGRKNKIKTERCCNAPRKHFEIAFLNVYLGIQDIYVVRSLYLKMQAQKQPRR